MKQKKRNSFAVLGYTKDMMAPMVAFTAAANAIFAALIIAHRMRTVDGVDKIVVLKDGRVAETGIPAELKRQAEFTSTWRICSSVQSSGNTSNGGRI